MRLAAAALLGLVLLGCGDRPPPPPDPGDAAARAAVRAALDSCLMGNPTPAIAALDTLLLARPADVDARASRGICHRVRFADDSTRADAEAARDDLTDAIERLEGGAASAFYTLDALLSHRAYVHESLDPGVWDGTVTDLARAARLAPDEPTHRLDLGIARSLAGDTAGAVADLRRFLAMAPRDSTRGPVVRRHLAALGDSAALLDPALR